MPKTKHYDDQEKAFPGRQPAPGTFEWYNWHGMAQAIGGSCVALGAQVLEFAIWETPRYGRVILWYDETLQGVRIEAEDIYLVPEAQALKEQLEDDYYLAVKGVTFDGRRDVVIFADPEGGYRSNGAVLYYILQVLEKIQDKYHPSVPDTIDEAVGQVQRALEASHADWVDYANDILRKLGGRIRDHQEYVSRNGATRQDIEAVERFKNLLDQAAVTLYYSSIKTFEEETNE